MSGEIRPIGTLGSRLERFDIREDALEQRHECVDLLGGQAIRYVGLRLAEATARNWQALAPGEVRAALREAFADSPGRCGAPDVALRGRRRESRARRCS